MTEIDFDIDDELLAQVERLAAWRGISRDTWLATAIRHAALQDVELEAKLREGIDDANAGRLISQEDMETWFATRHQQAAAE